MSNNTLDKKAFLIDSTGFVLKYWFSMPVIKTKGYESISAFLGFCNFVIKFLQTYKPLYLSFAFDESLGTCFRNKIYPDYKRSREKAPEELKIQFKLCREFLNLLGISNMASKEYEADDILYTLSKNNREKKLNNIIITNDKDLYQIIHEGDLWWDFAEKKYTQKDLIEKLGFLPQKLPDYFGLMGDAVDGIPGAPGIGNKTASALMIQYKNLDNILMCVDTIPLKLGESYKRFIKIIEDNKKIIYLSKKLATLEYIDSLNKNINSLNRKEVDFTKLDNFLSQTGMKEGQKDSWIKNIKKSI